MMRITILALGSTGDVLPYIHLGQALKERGHRVRFATMANFSARVNAAGLDYFPIRGDARVLLDRSNDTSLSMARSFITLADSYAADLSAPELADSDLILNQLPAALYGYDLAERYGIPMATLAVIPLQLTSSFPIVGSPNMPLPGYNRATYHFMEQLVWQLMRPAINRWRRNTLGLPKTSLRGYFSQLRSGRFPALNGFSPLVVQRPPDWPDHIHITGYWFPKPAEWQPPPALLEFLAAGPTPIFIGFGSMPVRDKNKAIVTILEAVRLSGERAILHAGWAGLAVSELPKGVFSLDYAPYEWLFPRMKLVIHHGGSGTTAAALRAGVPNMVVPFVFDQFYWGRRIAELGVGLPPIPFRRMSVARLLQAIEGLGADPDLPGRSADFGQKIEAEDGLKRAVQLIEGFGAG